LHATLKKNVFKELNVSCFILYLNCNSASWFFHLCYRTSILDSPWSMIYGQQRGIGLRSLAQPWLTWIKIGSMWCNIWLWKWYLGGITGISWQGR
jgi:hypothetical protein